MSAVRALTLIPALKRGEWSARLAHTLDEDVLPSECPFGGPSAEWVWAGLRELQREYQDREPGWEEVPREFERLARGLYALLALAGSGSTR